MTSAKRTAIEVSTDSGVGVVLLARPERLNAYTATMGVELFETIAEMDADENVRAIVVSGKGRAFCAGADLEDEAETFSGQDTWAEASRREAQVRPWNISTPIIAAINGPAVGIGASMPLSFDIRIAAERAKIGFVFTRRGIIPEANSTWILSRLVGMAKAMDLLLTGRIVKAPEALELGIVSRVVPDDRILDEAIAIGRDIATNTAPASIAITKRLLWRQLMEPDPRRSVEVENECFHWIGKQPDAGEGVMSFLEKRDPAWRGKKNDLPEVIQPIPD